jgi:PAS domain S-box-containing protein
MRLVKQTRDVLVVSDVKAEPEWADREDYAWVRSWAGAPILVRGEAIGVFCLDHTQAGFYGDSHRPILEALAAQISIATENALLFEQVQEYALGLQRKVMERTAEIGVQEERMNAILSSIDDAVIAFGVDGRVSYVNSAVFRMMGWDEAGANGRHVLDFLHQMTSRQTFRETVRAMRKQQSWRSEVVLKHRDGYPVVVDAVGVPYREQTNAVVGYIVSMRHLSDERETERMKARFMSLISHELRTPVTNLKLHLHLVRKTVDDPEKHQHHLAALEHQTARLADMMEKVLRVTRLADSDELLTDELIGFETLLDNVIVRYAEQAKAHDIVLAAENRFDRPVRAQGDERWFSAACYELLDNALQYTPPGQRIVVRLEPYEQDGQTYVSFSVQDTGPGINAEDLARLNLSFTRAGDQRSGSTAGMGLGLFLARSVVERLGGGIAVESEPGEGSIFTLYLPEVVT